MASAKILILILTVSQHLDYIQDMGFDAIWISPVTAQIEAVTAYGEAYHGYWQRDIFSINSHFGTEDELKSLSDALHGRRMVRPSNASLCRRDREPS